MGLPESECSWRAVVEEVLCCVRAYWRESGVREGEEEADHRVPWREMVVVVGQCCGMEGCEEVDRLDCLWTVLGWGAEALSGPVKEGVLGRLRRAVEGGALVCLEAEGSYLC